MLDFAGDFARPFPSRHFRGRTAHLRGLSAEESVERVYEEQGCQVARRRWRGPGGEIDLIVRDGRQVIFVEVKSAADFDRAAARIRPRQMARIAVSAEAFLGGEPDGLLTETRIDVALVDGQGRVRIIENTAFA